MVIVIVSFLKPGLSCLSNQRVIFAQITFLPSIRPSVLIVNSLNVYILISNMSLKEFSPPENKRL